MFNVIPFVLYSMLNLLDRASTPITILNTAKQALKPQGKLIPIQSDYNCCTLMGSKGLDGHREGRDIWIVITLVLKVYINVSSFVGSTSLGTYIAV